MANRKQINLNQKGSALVLTVIILVTSLVLVTSFVFISAMERKMSNKTKSSVAAFQLADSAVEVTLKEVRDAVAGMDMNDFCDSGFDTSSGECDFPKRPTDTKVYFVDSDNKIITDDTFPLADAKYLRAVGVMHGAKNDERVNRALQVSLVAACGGEIKHEGENYDTVRIGDQCWMAENLRVGERIAGVDNPSDPSKIEKYCYGDVPNNCDNDGGLYQWEEMMDGGGEGDKGICPDGWHIPTDAEWHALEDGLKGTGEPCCPNRNNRWECKPAGGELQKTVSGKFNALMSGYRCDVAGGFKEQGIKTWFWSSTKNGLDEAFVRSLDASSAEVSRSSEDKEWGYSVRCVKN